MQSKPIALNNFKAKGFWKEQMELVRKEVIPYQWKILNDRIKDAAPSFCMRNFKVAGKLLQKKREMGEAFIEPVYTDRGFEVLPKDPEHLEDEFYGFVFQDSDFYKWIEAVAYSLINSPDKELEKTADKAIDIVCAAQHESGYLDTYYIINGMDKIFTNLQDHHELYCFGHLTEGAVAYYQATGKRKLLDACIRFADFIADYFGTEEGKCKGYPGHEIVEMALFRLYEVTGEERYKDLACFFIDERGRKPFYWDREPLSHQKTEEEYQYHQAHRPVREQEEAVGHAVRAMYLYSGMTDEARIKKDEELWNACKRLWDSTVNEKMYITGGVGGTNIEEAFSYPFDLPNDLAYAETCASIGLIFWARRMLEKEISAEYGDVMERALYNTVLAGMALDGKSFFYVNPLEVLPEACHKDKRKEYVKPIRQKWFGCACCPPNLARLISSVPVYAYTESEDTIFMHLHISGEITKEINGKEAVFEVVSGFPWNGKVIVSYKGKESVNMNLAVRVPGWCSEKTIKIPKGIICTEKNGYCYLSGEWKQGDMAVFDFPMKIKFYQADNRVREDIGKICVMKGPVVYCAEERDNGSSLHEYRALLEGKVSEGKKVIGGKEFPCIILSAEKLVSTDTESEYKHLYREYTVDQYKEQNLILIPYYTWANRGENEMMVWLRK